MRRYKFYLATFILLLMGVIIILPIVGIYSIKVNTRLHAIKNRNKAIEAYIQENNIPLKALENINRLETLVEKAMDKTQDWGQYIMILGESRPNEVIIDIIKTGLEEDETVLTIDGRAQSQGAVTAYIAELEKSDALESIKCNYVRQIASQGGYSAEFQLIIYMGQVEQFMLDRGGAYEENTN
ncbi:MAG TPA: PilN domain-containing protein [Clostridia bacterium]|nr:PilN domain-containing protein [Clostridia bacterium]